MNIFYNEKGMGDVLVVTLSNSEVAQTHTFGDVVQLMDVNNACVGVNIFQAKDKFTWVMNRYLDKEVYKQEVLTYLESQGVKVATTAKASFVVGYVSSCEKHPDSEKLSVCQVDVGTEVLQIVCGAKNIAANQHVVVATPGAQLKSGLFIVPSVLRKIDSNGMICSKKELDLEGESEGILVLNSGTPGESFYEINEEK